MYKNYDYNGKELISLSDSNIELANKKLSLLSKNIKHYRAKPANVEQ